jgi:hypothetical protein
LGYGAPEEPVELGTLRLSAVGRIVNPWLREISADAISAAAAKKSRRPVYFAVPGGFVD